MYIAFFNSFRQYIICILITDYACHRLIGTGNRNIQRKPPTCRKSLIKRYHVKTKRIITMFYLIQNYYYHILPNTELHIM